MKPASFLASLASALLLASCGDDKVAGGSTDTETGALAGVARLVGDAPVAGALVEAHPGDPSSSASGPVAPRFSATTDASGRWRIEGMPVGLWTLVLTESGGKRALLVSRHVRTARTDSSVAILHTTATVRILTSSVPRVWIEGTSMAADTAGGAATLSKVPAGYAFRLRAAGYVSDSLTLRPSQDTTIRIP